MSTITVTRNIIEGFYGSWGSGIATLRFMDGSSVYADNAPLARALDGAFGAIGNNHSIDNSAIAGQDIVYWLDDMGLILEAFVSYDEWCNQIELPELEIGILTEVKLNE